VDVANTHAGADTITFADDLLGGTLVLEQGALEVSDDLLIDGDAADGGAGGVVLAIEGRRVAGIRATDADLRLEDLTLSAQQDPFERTELITGVEGLGADVTLLRAAVTGLAGYYGAQGIRTRDGSLLVQSSDISGISSIYDARGIAAFGTTVRVVDSRISGLYGGEFADGIFTDAALELVDTVVRGITGQYGAYGVFSRGDAVITRTTIADVSGSQVASGLAAGGALALVNSTISGIDGSGVLVRGTGQGTITNTTIAGNVGSQEGGFAGLVVEDGAELRLENSLVAGNESGDEFSGFRPNDVVGAVDSNGHNVFGQAAVQGAVAGDVTGAAARDVFTVLDTEGRPVLADNGGPTPTVALRDAPGNPAVDAADPAVAPELDQRGFARVGAPDIGSFEAGAGDDGGGLDGLPPLAEKVAVDPSLINGVDAGLLRGDGETPFTITFLSEVAAKDNALGYYIVQEGDEDGSGEEGLILEAGILFESTEEATPGAGVQVGVLEEGQTLGLFLVADGADLNGDRLVGDPSLVFFDRQGNTAAVSDPVPDLFVNEPDGFGPVVGQVLHASDFIDDDEGNRLNPDGLVRTLSGRGEDGSLLVAWEDQTARSDTDFNDAILRIEGPGLGTGGAAILPPAQPEGQPGMDFLM
jgi:hypothetical protein